MRANRFLIAAVSLLSAALLAACAGMSGGASVDYAALLAAGERSAADRNTDKRRNAEQMLAFIGARPGMKVLDMGTGGGYSTELMARSVGQTGVVYAQDGKTTNQKFLAAFDQRQKGTPAMKNVVRVLRPFEDPLPPEVRDLDLVTFLFEYHEMANLKVDRARMNRQVFEALRPGGYYVVSDHSTVAGAGAGVAGTLHRIEEALVRREIEAAGFRLVEEGNFLRNPADKRDVIIFKSPVPVDDFFLKYQKPR